MGPKVRRPAGARSLRDRAGGALQGAVRELAERCGRSEEQTAVDCLAIGAGALASALVGVPHVAIVGHSGALEVGGAVAGLAEQGGEWTRALCSPATLPALAQASGAPVLLDAAGALMGALRIDGKPVTVVPWIVDGLALFVRELVTVRRGSPAAEGEADETPDDEVPPAPSPIPDDESGEETEDEPRTPRLALVRKEPEA